MRSASLLAFTASCSLFLACSSDSPDTGGNDAAPEAASGGARTGNGGTAGAPANGGAGGASNGGTSSGGKAGAGGTGGSVSGGAGGARDAGDADGAASGGASAGGSAGSADGGRVDASIADAGLTPESGLPDAGLGTDSGTDAGPPAVRLRFANLAPTTAPLDICMRETGAPAFTGTPLLRARGITTGLPYGSITDYLDLGAPRTLDFEFVESSTTTCAPPIRGALGNLAFVGPVSQTIAVYQYQFTPIDAYNPALLSAFGAPTAGRANVRVFDVVQPSFGAASIDFYATPPAGAEEKWFTNVAFGSGTAFHAAGAGAHTFRVTSYNTQTVLAQKAGVVLSVGAALDAFLFPTSATTFGLLRCPSTQTALVGACAL